jgi:hypothetical protein
LARKDDHRSRSPLRPRGEAPNRTRGLAPHDTGRSALPSQAPTRGQSIGDGAELLGAFAFRLVEFDSSLMHRSRIRARLHRPGWIFTGRRGE